MWGLFNQNVSLNQIIRPGGLLSFGAKFLGEPAEHYAEWSHGKEGMIREAHRLLSDADVLVTYNGDNFDIKHMAWEFARLGLPRPRPFKSIDLVKVVP